MPVTTQRMTAEDLFKMPQGDNRHELIEGILKEMSPAGRKHGKLAIRIGASLDRHVEANGLGEVYAAETGFKIASDPDTVRAPDAGFVGRARAIEMGDTEGFVPGAPDLAIEVVSPSDSFAEVEAKVLDWLAAGARMVVVANSRKKTLTVYRSLTDIKVLTEKDTLSGEDVVPGWNLPVKGLFD